jgi:hypothetical protein
MRRAHRPAPPRKSNEPDATRSAPRDALVAESVDDADRGKAFGLEGFGDNLGACLGPLLAIALRTCFHTALRTMFLLAFVPGALAGSMVVFVREKPGAAVASKTTLSPKLARLPEDYWKALLATALFGIGNSSNAFLILRTKALGASLTTTILIVFLMFYGGFQSRRQCRGRAALDANRPSSDVRVRSRVRAARKHRRDGTGPRAPDGMTSATDSRAPRRA